MPVLANASPSVIVPEYTALRRTKRSLFTSVPLAEAVASIELAFKGPGSRL